MKHISWKSIGQLARRVIPERFRPSGYLTESTRKRTGGRVAGGPFVGMSYIGRAYGSAYIPKLLGIYERECADAIEDLVARAPRLVVDIGAAEGYYAVGLALRLPGARIVAFEMNPGAREALREMARLNAVDNRLEIRGRCDPEELMDVLVGESVVIVCDVEGYEDVLLDPDLISALKEIPILVELHDFIVDGVTVRHTDRFCCSHRLVHILEQDRQTEDFQRRTLGTALLPRTYLEWAVSEWRPVRMAWLWMVPK